MRLLIIRHGDPDYAQDNLTAAGEREAALLAERLSGEKIGHIFVSPLGRARRTAEPTLKALGQEAQVLDWLREFPAQVDINGSPFLQAAYPDTERGADGRFLIRSCCWDMVPSAWTKDPDYYDPVNWRRTPSAKAGNSKEVYDKVCRELDQLLARQGYRREKNRYVTDRGSHETLAFFCHFGLACVLLSHLWNISPYVLFHSLALAPTSVTELYSEEREKGQVYFRGARLGDVSHLYAAGQQPSFAARFCEVFEDEARH